MDAERRKEILERSLTVGRGTEEITEDELNALLARDEALERVEALPDLLEGRSRCNQQRSDAASRAEVYQESAHLVRKALGRD